MTVSRRRLFAMAGAAGFFARFGSSADTDPAQMIVRSPRPVDLEMPLAGFNDAITPIERFFVRTHTYTPQVDAGTWSLKVEGTVGKPLTLTMAELKKLPRVEMVAVVECAGNGRSFYRPRMPGAQWEYGSVGNARWTGVRLKDVLAKAGVKEGAKHVLFDGADEPMGKMEDFRRSITIEKALDADTLLAFEMNGQEIPLLHGFPLRVVVPGWASDSWVKWLTRIEVLDHEYDGFWMKSAYRHPTKPVAAGTAVDPSQMVPVTDLNVKSVLASPSPGAVLGVPVKVSGAAWSNTSPVVGVDVSVDGGNTWIAATLGKDLGRYSWRLFDYSWMPEREGDTTVMARARNAAGAVQPMEQEWNPSGYLWNVVHRVPVNFSYPAGYRAACLPCHDEHMMVQQHLTRAQWEKETDKMVRWGADVKPDARETILRYLSERFK